MRLLLLPVLAIAAFLPATADAAYELTELDQAEPGDGIVVQPSGGRSSGPAASRTGGIATSTSRTARCSEPIRAVCW